MHDNFPKKNLSYWYSLVARQGKYCRIKQQSKLFLRDARGAVLFSKHPLSGLSE